MSTRHRGKLNRLIYYWWLQIAKLASRIGRSFRNLLLQPLQILKPGLKRQEAAGFVLPTITMIILVVSLVVSAIVLRSFDRANNARNIRVNQAVLAAAQPALDRANAKLNYLLTEDPTLSKTTPTDAALYKRLSTDDSAYTFGDEERLKVRYDINLSGKIDSFGFKDNNQPVLSFNEDDYIEDNEEINTAWRFPIDTDSNGKFDTFTLYGIYLKTPTRETTGEFKAARSPLDVRTPPMPPLEAGSNSQCAGALGTSASLVGDSGWYKSDAKLKKSFYVFAVNVPITEIGTLDPGKYETGKSGFSALEYQQDRSRIPLTNNAVVYDNDLEVTPGAGLNLNGRIQANSNFIVSYTNSTPLTFYQVSSPESCFYDPENSKILVGGNVVNGKSDTSGDRRPVGVHLFNGANNSPNTSFTISTSSQSVSNTSLQAQYNNNAYEQRIACLLEAQIGDPASPTPESNDPKSVTDAVKQKLDENPSLDRAKVRRQELEAYFRNRTRQVPFAEVADGAGAISGAPVPPADQAPWCRQNAGSVLAGSKNTLRPIDSWIWPTAFSGGVASAGGPTNLTVVQLPATEFGKQKDLGKEQFLGDRILVGNNLPAVWWNGTKFAEGPPNPPETDNLQKLNEKWADPNNEQRTRATRVRKIPEVGAIDRDGFWERAAAVKPQTAVSGTGGLRIVTSGGVYERLNSFLPPPPAPADDPTTKEEDESKFTVVWPDTMPMSPGAGSKVYDNKPINPGWVDLATASTTTAPGSIDPKTPKFAKGDLRMRATAVYHYAQDPIDPPELTGPNKDTDQKPIACISSYYDPTDFETARNAPGLPDVSGWQDKQGPTKPPYVWSSYPSIPPSVPTSITNSKSNNGVSYPKPTTARPSGATYNSTTGLFTGSSDLEKQANMVFPDGRFANKPLREALKKLVNGQELTLADQSAIDSTLCALDILSGKISPNDSVIPHGAIKEISFLNPREIKAVDKNDPTTAVDETFTLNSPLLPNTQAAKLTGLYDQPIEERQPLEIRVTQIDLNLLRNKSIGLASGINGPDPEYLLPNSGIIYATRDDALPDRSYRSTSGDSSKLISPTDFRLDPTRRPNGIMLINGQFLARHDGNNDGQNDTKPKESSDVVKEKGLTLVSNEPVYVQGDFNLHSQQEFKTALSANWSDFYTRTISNINENFACRENDPRIPKCTQGDTWRPATVLADAVTLLSDTFRPGFRNEGDFDLRNNAGNPLVIGGYDIDGSGTIDVNTFNEVTIGLDLNGDGDTTDPVAENQISVGAARRLNGFLANDYAINGLSMGGSSTFDINGDSKVNSSDNTPRDIGYTTLTVNNDPRRNSSYFNNFVTPVQRRGKFPEYLMEICRKLPVSACQPGDWVVGLDDGNGKFDPSNPDEVITASDGKILGKSVVDKLLSGTTARPPLDPADQRYPRRVAFERTSNKLSVSGTLPQPLGISSDTPPVVKAYPYSGGTLPRIADNALWFKTTTSTTDPTTGGFFGNSNPLFYQNKLATTSTTQQPLLVPVLQLYISNNKLNEATPPSGTGIISLMTNTKADSEQGYTQNQSHWQPRVEKDHTFNLAIGAKDVPARTLTASAGETGGGLQNLPRFMENWSLSSTVANQRTTNILGSLIQLGRSEYATGPYQPLRNNASIFGINQLYSNVSSSGQIPYFNPPKRAWGYDIGLLSQPPDLFGQTFTDKPSTDTPSEFFREVSRDDDWVKTLLCAVEDKSGQPAVSSNQRPTQFCKDKTGG